MVAIKAFNPSAEWMAHLKFQNKFMMGIPVKVKSLKVRKEEVVVIHYHKSNTFIRVIIILLNVPTDKYICFYAIVYQGLKLWNTFALFGLN